MRWVLVVGVGVAPVLVACRPAAPETADAEASESAATGDTGAAGSSGEDVPRVECQSPSDCPEPNRPVCALETGTCVECTPAALTACSPGAVCLLDTCSSCSDAPEPDAACESAAISTNEPTPICDPTSGQCVQCTEAIPSSCGPDGVCDPTSGRCVQCTQTDATPCRGATPICALDTQTCQPCRVHAECMERIGAGCNLATGRCLPGPDAAPNAVVHVRQTALPSGVLPDGSPERPFYYMFAALQAAPSDATIILHEGDDGAIDLSDSALIQGTRAIAILAAAGERPTWNSALAPPLLVDPGARAFVRGLRIVGGTVGARVHGDPDAPHTTALYIDDTEILDYQQHGIEASAGGAVFLRNAIIGSHAGDASVRLSDSSAWLTYTTLVSPVTPLSCTNARVGSIRNSIVLSPSAQLDCPPLDVLTTVTGQTSLSEQGWFRDWEHSDFHLGEYAPPILQQTPAWWADATLPDPSLDIDGDPRPSPRGVDYVGADVR